MKLRKCCRAAWKEPQRNFSSFFVICAVRLSSTPLRLSLGEPSILSEGCAKRQAFPALSVNRLRGYAFWIFRTNDVRPNGPVTWPQSSSVMIFATAQGVICRGQFSSLSLTQLVYARMNWRYVGTFQAQCLDCDLADRALESAFEASQRWVECITLPLRPHTIPTEKPRGGSMIMIGTCAVT